MIKQLGYREMPVASIRWADLHDKTERMAMDHVRELAVTYDLTDGPLNAPVVRKSDKKLVAGHDRVAAAALMKRETMDVHLVEGTDAELAEAAVIENLYRRRDDQDALKRQLVDLRAQRIKGQTVPKLPTAPKPGRPKSAEAIAREQIAKEQGTTPEALKAAAKRDRAREEAAHQERNGAADVPHGGANGTAVIPPAPPPPIRTFGLEIPGELLATVVAAQRDIDRADRGNQQVLAALSALAEVPGIATERVIDLREQFRRLGALLRGDRPEALCPYCKGRADLVPTCMFCGGQRYATARQMAGDLPKPLLLEGEAACVQVRGYSRPLAELLAPENRGGNGR